ncbi:hypothetical protein ACWGJW_02465 [Streptomyces nigrescens]
MATQANTTPPDLAKELKEVKRRLAAAERAPDTLNKFDRYPTTEWAAIGRGKTGSNAWSSCGIADVTGLVYDRVECKFITNNLVAGKREAEVRLAAFRHYGTAQKECVSASRSLRLHGASGMGVVGTGLIRWVHGIPFGWDYADGTATYSIELQHRYLVGPEATKGTRVFAIMAPEGSSTANLTNRGTTEDAGHWWFSPQYRDDSAFSGGFVTIPNSDDGSYAISNMHYCAGLPADRIPEASADGWAWYIGGASEWGGAGNVNDTFIG